MGCKNVFFFKFEKKRAFVFFYFIIEFELGKLLRVLYHNTVYGGNVSPLMFLIHKPIYELNNQILIESFFKYIIKLFYCCCLCIYINKGCESSCHHVSKL